MAEKRMLCKTIIDSDAFLDMPLTTQALYFHLNMRADDDGFVNNPKRIQRNIGAGDDDLRLLIMKKFVIAFQSGIIVIKHWKMHNYIQSDRYRPTVYQDEKNMLMIKSNKSYTLNGIDNEEPLNLNDVSTLYTECVQDDNTDKIRLDKNRLDKSSICPDKCPSKKERDLFFESIWELYPSKKGKASISDAKKKVLYSIGFDTIKNCIDRYVKDKEEWRPYKDGSTFFNSGYVDYLDENYVQAEPQKPKEKDGAIRW